MRAVLAGFRRLRSYPSAIAGLIMVMFLLALSGITVLAIPYGEAVRLWRGGEGVWDENPELARPVWIRYFTSRKIPETIRRDSREGGKDTNDQPDGTREVQIRLQFDFPYDEPPTEVGLWLMAKYEEAQPLVTLKWRRPDGKTIEFEDRMAGRKERYYLTRDERLREKLKARSVEEALFCAPPEDPAPVECPRCRKTFEIPRAEVGKRSCEECRDVLSEKNNGPGVVRGTYELSASALVFEPAGDFDLRLVVYGKLHGIAGTDDQRRDLLVALLWGTPVALLFGLLAAVGTTVFALIISATGAWFGGLFDSVIQRITEVNAMLPRLTFLVMIGMFYSRSIWVMLAAIILLSMFSLGIKTYRAIFLSLKEAPYIEAARAYGAGNFRIIFRYMIPRVIPMLIPAFVTGIPDFVFLEAGLSILGLGDPDLPTWGKLLFEAYSNDAPLKGHYHWVLEPAAFLMFTGMGFAMLGFALDRIFNPRLRLQ